MFMCCGRMEKLLLCSMLARITWNWSGPKRLWNGQYLVRGVGTIAATLREPARDNGCYAREEKTRILRVSRSNFLFGRFLLRKRKQDIRGRNLGRPARVLTSQHPCRILSPARSPAQRSRASRKTCRCGQCRRAPAARRAEGRFQFILLNATTTNAAK